MASRYWIWQPIIPLTRERKIQSMGSKECFIGSSNSVFLKLNSKSSSLDFYFLLCPVFPCSWWSFPSILTVYQAYLIVLNCLEFISSFPNCCTLCHFISLKGPLQKPHTLLPQISPCFHVVGIVNSLKFRTNHVIPMNDLTNPYIVPQIVLRI